MLRAFFARYEESASFRRNLTVVLVLIGLAISFTILCVIPFWALGKIGCEDSASAEAASPPPGQRFTAQVHTRDCGATTNWNTRVILQTDDGWFGRTTSETVVQGPVPLSALRLVWDSPNALAIEVLEYWQSAVTTQASSWHGVSIVVRRANP